MNNPFLRVFGVLTSSCKLSLLSIKLLQLLEVA